MLGILQMSNVFSKIKSQVTWIFDLMVKMLVGIPNRVPDLDPICTSNFSFRVCINTYPWKQYIMIQAVVSLLLLWETWIEIPAPCLNLYIPDPCKHFNSKLVIESTFFLLVLLLLK